MLVLRDVIAQQRHLPAPAVVAHFPLDTTDPRHLCLEVAPRQISTDHRPAHPHYTGVSQPCKAAPTAATAPRSSAYRFPRNMIRSATASIPSRGSTPLGIDSRTPCSRTRHSARRSSRAVGILRRLPRRGAPTHPVEQLRPHRLPLRVSARHDSLQIHESCTDRVNPHRLTLVANCPLAAQHTRRHQPRRCGVDPTRWSLAATSRLR